MIKKLWDDWKGLNKTDRIKNIILYIIGVIGLSLGIVLTIHGNLGAGGIDAMNFAIADKLGANPSVGVFIASVVSTVVAAVCRKGRVNWPAFITSLLCGQVTDFWEMVLADVQGTGFVSSLIIFVAGLIALGVAVGCNVASIFPTGPMDDLTVAVSECGVRMWVGKIIIEGVAALIAFLLGGEIGLGTLIVVFGLGPIIDFCHVTAKRIAFGKAEK